LAKSNSAESFFVYKSKLFTPLFQTTDSFAEYLGTLLDALCLASFVVEILKSFESFRISRQFTCRVNNLGVRIDFSAGTSSLTLSCINFQEQNRVKS
jgi:hypothetical protein